MNKTTPTVIRLSVTNDIRKVLSIAKKRYPALSDPEILKLGLSKIVTDESTSLENDRDEIRLWAAYAVGEDYLRDDEEDIYTANTGKKVHFS